MRLKARRRFLLPNGKRRRHALTELIAARGLYWRLYPLQFGAQPAAPAGMQGSEEAVVDRSEAEGVGNGRPGTCAEKGRR